MLDGRAKININLSYIHKLFVTIKNLKKSEKLSHLKKIVATLIIYTNITIQTNSRYKYRLK